jgi:prepilin-type processing-associated H-X9-DG protein
MIARMKVLLPLVSITLGVCLSPHCRAASGIPAFYGDPPDAQHPWAVHDPNRPQPTVVTPGTFSSQAEAGRPPSDAIVLFDGSDLSKWESAKEGGGSAKWVVSEGLLEVAPSTGDIRTKEEFGDCQLHIEWAEPPNVSGSSQGRGNSGIFLMGLVEIQVLDSYHNVTYADGHAASVYGVNPPMANPLRPPGEFQVYDIIFRRPVYKDGQPLDPGYVTVFVNGVVAQDHTALEGATGHMWRTHPAPFPEKGPLKLQDHGNPVRFRNIWYRPLPPNAIEGGSDGPLTTEAAAAKRKEIAADIRGDANQLKNASNPVPEMLRLLESLEYDKEPATVEQVNQMATRYVDSLKELPGDKIGAKKDEANHVNGAFQYVTRFQVFPADWGPRVELEKIVKAQRWDKK